VKDKIPTAAEMLICSTLATSRELPPCCYMVSFKQTTTGHIHNQCHHKPDFST